MPPKYSIGIDLGTTNSALAYVDLDARDAHPQILPIYQAVAPGVVEPLPLLPSFGYIPTDDELASGALPAHRDEEGALVVGRYARDRAADAAVRTIAAAKSWLCYPRVDRRKPILPWNAPRDVPKRSPVGASRAYLSTIIETWNRAHPESPFAEQIVVLTVPASFDASARELTREAAIAAGFPAEFVLLEEPQAALYAWLDSRGEKWRKQLKPGESILVCDVGGGTTDFTLIEARDNQGDLELHRVAVGNHILLGGDNMDVALAVYAQQRFAEKGHKLDAWQSVSLWHACRHAKETLLGPEAPERTSLAIAGRGTRLIGGSISIEISRDEVRSLLLEGFYPRCAPTDRPASRGAGFRQLGLPFETDTAITRHLAGFLADHAGLGRGPTHVLFNGGVFKAGIFRDRLLEVLRDWFGDSSGRWLKEDEDLDFAVARGAACYGRAKTRGGIRIRGGTARAYYVGIETALPAVPGVPRPVHALCVAPVGMEEGTSCEVPGEEIALVVGERAHFRFFSSTQRMEDRPGVILEQWSEDELQETDSLETVLPANTASDAGWVPVRLETRLTELGVLEIWCVESGGNRRWKLEFSVREPEGEEATTPTAPP
ncbi:MAG: Hsp70 family protein [Kiritimatiellae bacterium]|nr:Hsp70 family protein [Kiritimatiellia bacterium]MDW8458667.1 Hsp70 family protein [Verrucomicrobiota bacterium]